LYEIILEYRHNDGPYNLTLSVFDPLSSLEGDLAFEMWSALCLNFPNGTAISYPYKPPFVYDQAVVWQPTTIWTVGLPVLFNIKTVDAFGNLSYKNPESSIFFCFVSGPQTPTDIAEIVNYRFPLQTRWVLCANEGQTCFFAGSQIVGYGSLGVPLAFKQAFQSIQCSTDAFGSFSPFSGNSSTTFQCYLSMVPSNSAISKYLSTSIGLLSPSERLNIFVSFRNASTGLDLSLFSSQECSPHSLVGRTKSGVSLNCSELRKSAVFQCVQLDGVIAFLESGLYEIGMWTSDDVVLFMGSEMVLRSASSLKAQFYSMSRYFKALDTVLFRASVLPSTDSCMTSLFWKLSIPGVM